MRGGFVQPRKYAGSRNARGKALYAVCSHFAQGAPVESSHRFAFAKKQSMYLTWAGHACPCQAGQLKPAGAMGRAGPSVKMTISPGGGMRKKTALQIS